VSTLLTLIQQPSRAKMNDIGRGHFVREFSEQNICWFAVTLKRILPNYQFFPKWKVAPEEDCILKK